MASNNAFSASGFLDDLSSGANKALALFNGYRDAEADRKLRAAEVDIQAKKLLVDQASIQRDREIAQFNAAQSLNLQDGVVKVASILAAGLGAMLGGYAIVKVVKAFK